MDAETVTRAAEMYVRGRVERYHGEHLRMRAQGSPEYPPSECARCNGYRNTNQGLAELRAFMHGAQWQSEQPAAT